MPPIFVPLQAGSRSHSEKPNLDKLDKALIYGQILSFARTIRTLDEQAASGFLPFVAPELGPDVDPFTPVSH